MTTESRRLSILTVQEVDDLYRLPRFTEDERRRYFDLSPAERDMVDRVYPISVAAHLVLQLGYFKAKQQFFVYTLDGVTDDLGHILRRYFPTRDMAEIKGLSKPTRLEQQQVILKLFGYQLCDAAGLIDDAPLLEAVAFLQELLRQSKSPRQAKPADFPTGIFAKGVQRYMYSTAEKRKDKRLEVDRYEFLVYRLLRNALEAGNVYVRDSKEAIKILKGISPVAWRNINLTGNFDFTTDTSPVDIEALAARYENPDFWRQSMQEKDDPEQ